MLFEFLILHDEKETANIIIIIKQIKLVFFMKSPPLMDKFLQQSILLRLYKVLYPCMFFGLK